MTTTSSHVTPTLGRAIAVGAGAGVIASLVMAMYAMIAGGAAGTGFLTPLYHIASLWAAPTTMEASMEAAMGGDAFYWAFGPAVLGAVIHMMTGAMYGALFGLIVARLRLGVAALTAAGLVWGIVVFVLSAFVALPVAAALFGSGDPIRNMAEMAGWATFFVEHVIYGIVLGLLVGLARRRTTAPAAAH
jgi:hypothetical protein